MSDRRADDDTQPLAPRRTLSAPERSAPAAGTAAPAAAPARTQPPGPSAQPAPATSSQSRTPASPPRPGVRKARLRVTRVDPWSVMKMAFALSIALAVMSVVAVFILWSVLSAAGVWDAINNAVSTVLESDSSGFDVTNYVGLARVLGVTMVIAAVDVVLITALATLGAFLYNLAASLLGGLEVTLAEDR